MPRDTGTGGVQEESVLPALRKGGYSIEQQVHVGSRLYGGDHYVDAVASKGGRSVLVSQKWQQTGGTAEEKVAFEIIALAHAVKASNGRYAKAYLVLGGVDHAPGIRANKDQPGRKTIQGWKMRKWFISGGLRDHIVNHDLIEIMDTDTFKARANRGEL